MTATTNAQTIERFYGAFAQLDAATMEACYAPDAVFDDEAFSLRGRREVGGMWRMLCEATKAKGADVWRLRHRDVRAGLMSLRNQRLPVVDSTIGVRVLDQYAEDISQIEILRFRERLDTK